MLYALRRRATVKAGGIIEIQAPELEPDTEVEVIILEVDTPPVDRPLRSIIGTGKGAFETPEEADAFIRGERDTWGFRFPSPP